VFLYKGLILPEQLLIYVSVSLTVVLVLFVDVFTVISRIVQNILVVHLFVFNAFQTNLEEQIVKHIMLRLGCEN